MISKGFHSIIKLLLLGLILTVINGVNAQAFKTSPKDKFGLDVDLTTVFTENGLTEINQKVTQLVVDYNYDIGIILTSQPIKLRRKETLTQQILNELEEETRDDAYRRYGKLDIGPKPDKKGILIDLDFRIHHDRETKEATAYTYQHVAFGDNASLLMKIGVGSFTQDTKVNLYTNDREANDVHVMNIINKVEEYLKIEKAYGDSAMVFGPLVVYYQSIQQDSKEKIVEDDFKYYKKTLLNARAVIEFLDEKVEEKTFEFSAFNLNFYYDDKKNKLHSASISFEPSAPQPIGQLGFINVDIKSAEVQVDAEGKLTGGFVMNAYTNQDLELTSLIRIKKGIRGSCNYTFSGEDSFAGVLDLSRITGINVEMLKGKKTIAALTGVSFNDQGELSGKLTLKDKPELPFGIAKMEVKKLDVNVKYSLKNGLDIPKGTASILIKDIKGVEGSVKFNTSYTEQGGLVATMDQSGSNLKGYGCDFTQLSANLVVDNEWNVQELSGNFKLKHEDLDGLINVTNFIVKNGRLTNLEAVNSEVSYLGFNFNLKKLSYRDTLLSFTANMLMKLDDDYFSEVVLEKFTIDKKGEIAIGSLGGTINYPGIKMKFLTSYSDRKFSGSFSGAFRPFGVTLKGAFDVGMDGTGKTAYDYGYAHLALKSSTGVNIPATPFKLTAFGGRGGYNYYLESKNNTFVGSPKRDTYVFGLMVGVSDAAGIIGLNCESIVIMGQDLFELYLLGDVSIPQRDPYFTGGLNLHYTYDNHNSTFDGSLSSQIMIPSSGSIFSTNKMTLNFDFGQEHWRVNTEDSIKAKLFSTIDYVGFVDLQGGYEENAQMTGTAAGKISYKSSYTFNESISVFGYEAASASGHLNSHVWAGGVLELQNDYFSLKTDMGIIIEGHIDAELLGGVLADIHMSGYVNAQGQLEMNSNSIKASAIAMIEFIEYEEDGVTIESRDNFRFNACQVLNAGDESFHDCH